MAKTTTPRKPPKLDPAVARAAQVKRLAAMARGTSVYAIPVPAEATALLLTCLGPQNLPDPKPTCLVIGYYRHERDPHGWRCCCCGFVRPSPMHAVRPEHGEISPEAAAALLVRDWTKNGMEEDHALSQAASRFHITVAQIEQALVRHCTALPSTTLPPAA